MKYRPDIDGLRAIAVIAVILYHFKVPGFTGGYIGVDVFFVISGFLITGIIREQLRTGHFSVMKFYERRARRILPALTLVVLVTCIAGYFLLLPEDFERLGESAAAVSLFGSNFYFWKIAGYFSPTAHELPLLHTWSLAVEEQFYVLWPLALMLMYRSRRRQLMIGVVALIFVVSLVAGEWLLRRGSVAAGFYFSPVRIWELMIGAALALSPAFTVRAKSTSALVGVAGILLVLVPVVLYDDSTVFPGLSALVPCLGTAMLIRAGEPQKSASRIILGARPLVFIGLISYSLYLWHWPLVSFFNYTMFRAPAMGESALMLVACLLLSVLSWRLVEIPFRKRSVTRPASSRLVVGRALAVTSLTFVLGASLALSSGMPARIGKESRRVLELQQIFHPFARKCLALLTETAPAAECVIGAEHGEGPYQAVLWGDSHAAHWMPAVEAISINQGWAARQTSMAGCGPFVTNVWHSPRYQNCLPFNRAVLEEIASNKAINLVILAAHWGPYEEELKQIEETVRQVTALGKRVLILGQVPEADFPPNRCLALAAWRDRSDEKCAIRTDSELTHLIERQNQYFTSLKDQFPGVETFFPTEALCDEVLCRTSQAQSLLYLDADHVSPVGAAYLAQFMKFSQISTSVQAN